MYEYTCRKSAAANLRIFLGLDYIGKAVYTKKIGRGNRDKKEGKEENHIKNQRRTKGR
jgi:hypothetical protein